jgi:RsiW-degrading membrane proteinase PrsW (M82 family)
VSLIKCPDCGKDVSTREASCPHCGSPLTTEEIEVGTDLIGKKYRLYLVLGILVCSLGWILFFSEDKFSEHTGVSFIVIGLIGYIVAKILIWSERD